MKDSVVLKLIGGKVSEKKAFKMGLRLQWSCELVGSVARVQTIKIGIGKDSLNETDVR